MCIYITCFIVFHVRENYLFIGCELVTPPLDGLVLPGVVRASLLDLARKWVSVIFSYFVHRRKVINIKSNVITNQNILIVILHISFSNIQSIIY